MTIRVNIISFLLALLLGSVARAQTPSLTTVQPLQILSTNCTSLNGNYPPTMTGYVWQATLQGRIHPNGATITAVSFQYGATAAYGQEIAGLPYYTEPNGDLIDTARIQVSGFTLNYHYRLKVVTTTGTFYGNDLTFVPIYPVAANFSVVRPCSDSPTMAVFEFTNHSPYTLPTHLSYGDVQSDLTFQAQSQQSFFASKYSVVLIEFTYLTQPHILHYLTNNQSCGEDPDPINSFQLYPLGRTYWNENGAVDNFSVFEVTNPNTFPCPVYIATGTSLYAFTMPALSRNQIFCRGDVEAIYNGNTFAAVTASNLPWTGIATVTAEAISSTSTEAIYALQNNDSVAHTVKLENTSGLSHSYTLSAYSSQTVTTERSNWNVKLHLPNSSGEGVVNQFITVGTVSPGPTTGVVTTPDTLQPPCNPSSRTIQVASNSTWSITSRPSWVTFSAMSGSGSGTVTANIAANVTATARSGYIVVTAADNSQDSIAVVQDALVSNALSFDGVDDYVSGAPSCDVSLENGFTIEAWVYRSGDNPGAIQFLCAKNLEQLEIHLNHPSNTFRFIPTTGVYIDANSSLPLNSWVHIACSYRPATAEAHCYVNGIEVTWTNNGPNPLTTAIAVTGAPLTLGRRTYGGYSYKGAIEEFRIWSGLQTLSQIQTMMRSRVTPSDNPNLVLVYSFDQGSAGASNTGHNILIDATVNSLHSTLNNFGLSGTTSNWVYSDAQNSILDPMAPTNLTVTTTANNANLNWVRVNTDIYGFPVTVTNYLIYFRNSNLIPWQFLAYTTGADATSYSHLGVVRFSPNMYYHVTSYTNGGLSGSDAKLRSIVPGTSKDEVERQLSR